MLRLLMNGGPAPTADIAAAPVTQTRSSRAKLTDSAKGRTTTAPSHPSSPASGSAPSI
jgi:hypothetical protein